MQGTLVIAVALLAWVLAAAAHSVDQPPSPLTITQAIQFGIDHFPSVRASLARVSAAQSGVDLTRTAYLPRLDMGFQASRSTFNNVSGLFFPNPFTQPISGPALISRTNFSRHHQPGRAFCGHENAHHAGGDGCGEYLKSFGA
jgi:hypothetical protein